MPRSGCSETAVDVGSGREGVLPVSISIEPSLCDDISWWTRANERCTCPRCCASRGKISQISRPGTFVAIGRNGPRYSLGAFGLGSKVSSWLGPPHIQNRITEVLADGATLKCGSRQLRQAQATECQRSRAQKLASLDRTTAKGNCHRPLHESVWELDPRRIVVQNVFGNSAWWRGCRPRKPEDLPSNA